MSSSAHQSNSDVFGFLVKSFFIRSTLLAGPHNVPMIDDSSTEWAIKKLLNQVKFSLNCTESKRVALSAICQHREPNDTELLASPLAPFGSGSFRDHIWLTEEVRAIPQPKHLSPWVWLLGKCVHMHFLLCDHLCANTLCVRFPLRAIFWGSTCVELRAKFEPAS